jgi:two-component system OmpR family response regulator
LVEKFEDQNERIFRSRAGERTPTEGADKARVRILIVEDDDRLADAVSRGLREQGHVVDRAADGGVGAALALEEPYDAIVLDLNLPFRDGLEVLRSLRAAGSATPVVVVTARDETEDVVAGLDAGADDYIRKPFALRELEARLRSVSRREAPKAPVQLKVGTLAFDLASRRVERGGREIALTARELAFLEYFMRNEGRVLTRPMIETALWDRTSETTSNVVDVYVRRLRVKIDADGEPPLLHTVRGIGYRMSVS